LGHEGQITDVYHAIAVHIRPSIEPRLAGSFAECSPNYRHILAVEKPIPI
jgi:hypothetical protein